MGVFCNVKPELEPRGFTAPNAVGKAGGLPKTQLLLVVQNVAKVPARHDNYYSDLTSIISKYQRSALHSIIWKKKNDNYNSVQSVGIS